MQNYDPRYQQQGLWDAGGVYNGYADGYQTGHDGSQGRLCFLGCIGNWLRTCTRLHNINMTYVKDTQ